jgi:hypothetical protein
MSAIGPCGSATRFRICPEAEIAPRHRPCVRLCGKSHRP